MKSIINISYTLRITIVFSFIYSLGYASDSVSNTLDKFINSKHIPEQQNAFSTIIENPDRYKDSVLTRLNKYLAKPSSTPDALLYLAAFIKDKRYISPLTQLINDEDYSSQKCIYSCPIIFALTVNNSSGVQSFPSLNKNLPVVHDLYSEIKKAENVSIKIENPNKYMTGPAVDKLLIKFKALPLSDVIKMAGPETKDGTKRIAAAVTLESRVIDDKYLTDLYWLAITGLPNDSSGEYKNAIHTAIYRAEKYRKMQKR